MRNYNGYLRPAPHRRGEEIPAVSKRHSVSWRPLLDLFQTSPLYCIKR
jgi:hypothetical protein